MFLKESHFEANNRYEFLKLQILDKLKPTKLKSSQKTLSRKQAYKRLGSLPHPEKMIWVNAERFLMFNSSQICLRSAAN